MYILKNCKKKRIREIYSSTCPRATHIPVKFAMANLTTAKLPAIRSFRNNLSFLSVARLNKIELNRSVNRVKSDRVPMTGAARAASTFACKTTDFSPKAKAARGAALDA